MAAEIPSPWLEARALTKAYGGVIALRDANLALRAGELRGLIGANGAGKSTLVKILTGLTAPTSGSLLVDGTPLRHASPHASIEAGIAAVPQELTVAPTLTVAENVAMGRYPRRGGFVRAREMRRRTAEVLESLSLPMRPDDVVGELPTVYQRLVMVARAFARSARLMIFDEPTATISPREVEYLLEAIRGVAQRDISILYVSHRLDEIDVLCTAVTVLRDGRVVADLSRNEVTRQSLVEHLTGSDVVRTARARVATATATATARTVLTLDDVSAPGLDGVSFEVRAGETVGLAGMAGSGAREALLAACGALQFAGAITIAGERVRPGSVPRAVRAGAGFLPGDRSLAAFSSHSIAFNVSLPTIARHATAGLVRRRSERSAVGALLERVALARDPGVPISDLSGGNQQKAILARWLGARPALLLLDDPTAGVDIATRPELYEQLRAMASEGIAILLLSSDVDELAELADRVVVLDRGSVVAELGGRDVSAGAILNAMNSRSAIVAGAGR